jgi:ABC-type antimicrobial peptide transport system permease subunit
MLRQGMVHGAIGIAVGAVFSLGLTRLLAGLLFGTKATDPLTFASVIVLLGTVALLASYFAARQATDVDPITALRYE